MRRACSAAALAALLIAAPLGAAETCRGTVYLTLDTGTMSQAEAIAATLRKHGVRATFFLANEKTSRGDHALDDAWAGYWKARVAEGHAFGSHTWHHGSLRGDLAGGRSLYVHMNGRREELDAPGLCSELDRVNEAFQRMTGRRLDAFWRAPGGRTTANTLAWAERCGYRHVHWAKAGFLGDELPSAQYPNEVLLERALRGIRDGDILMMHLGIRSRQIPFAPMLDPLVVGLKERGMCFATVTERKP